MTPDAEHADRIARIRAERASQGRAPSIQTAALYRLLAAVVDGSDRTTTPTS